MLFKKRHIHNSVADFRHEVTTRERVPVEAVIGSNNPSDFKKIYAEFVAWAQCKGLTIDQFKYIYIRYYDEFIGGL